jgi:hemolysin activation/secretion protein
VNLTRADDVLTAEWLTSPDVSDVNAYSLAYFRPLDDRWSLNTFAGLSDSDIEDVLPQLNIRGRGHYAGGQLTRILDETARYRTQLSGGWLYQYWEDEQEIGGATWDDRRLRLSMPNLTYGYSSRIFDSLSGRNFASVTAMANFAGQFGSSDKEEFIGEGGSGFTDGDFSLLRFQLARLQRLFQCDDQPGKWTLFAKADGQWSSDSLPPPVRRSLGGANSVRGYEEAEITGDNAVTGTLEFRTPLIQNFIPGLKKSDEYLDANPEAWQQHRLQFVIFADAGYVENEEPLPGEMDGESLYSVGAGLRLGFTKYSQMRADYAYALADTTEDTPPHGRVHLSLQLQF